MRIYIQYSLSIGWATVQPYEKAHKGGRDGWQLRRGSPFSEKLSFLHGTHVNGSKASIYSLSS